MNDPKVVALYADGQFPVAFTNVAEMSAKPIGKFGFGISKNNAADALRALADAIEAGKAITQKVTHSTHATVDDFVMHHIAVTFAASRAAE